MPFPDDRLWLCSGEIVTIHKFELSVIKKWENSVMHRAHWTAKRSCRLTDKHTWKITAFSGTIANPPSWPLNFLLYSQRQPSLHIMCKGWNSVTLTTWVPLWCPDEKGSRFFPNRFFFLDKLLKKWDKVQTMYTASPKTKPGHFDFWESATDKRGN